MRFGALAGVVARHAVWRVTGWTPAGRRVVAALGSADEGVRTVAGMLLVRSGPRARPLLREALGRRADLPMVLAVLGDVGDAADAAAVAPLARDADPAIARAARDALRVLAARAGGR